MFCRFHELPLALGSPPVVRLHEAGDVGWPVRIEVHDAVLRGRLDEGDATCTGRKLALDSTSASFSSETGFLVASLEG
jgi:hypothetical protein